MRKMKNARVATEIYLNWILTSGLFVLLLIIFYRDLTNSHRLINLRYVKLSVIYESFKDLGLGIFNKNPAASIILLTRNRDDFAEKVKELVIILDISILYHSVEVNCRIRWIKLILFKEGSCPSP